MGGLRRLYRAKAEGSKRSSRGPCARHFYEMAA